MSVFKITTENTSLRQRNFIDDNFLSQVVEEPIRTGVLLHLILMTKEELVGEVKVRDSFGSSDHELIEFRILRGGNRAKSSIPTLDFKRANFGLSKDLLKRIPWGMVLEWRGVQETWLIFKDHLFQSPEQCRKSRKYSQRSAWTKRSNSTETERERRWKQNRVTQKECRDTVWVCRDQFRKAKTHLDLNLSRDVKSKSKSFYRYMSSKKKAKINVGLLLNVARSLVSKDMQKVEIHNAFFT